MSTTIFTTTPELIAYLKAIGRLGGQAKTPRKAKSSRRNGRKGGRPKTKQ